jgi:hypothetical protein
MDEKEIDIMSITETNVKWSMLEEKDRIWSRVSPWFEHCSIAVGCNSTDPNASRDQRGGTCLITRGNLAMTCSSGSDESNLGRWSWSLLKGTNGINTRVISAYSPSGSGKGIKTVYSQQLAILNDNPIRRFWEDLGSALQNWIFLGERIILLGDWNEDITNPQIQE